ncbi:ATP-dependent protease [Desulfurella acetivorans A63]|nr:ATP-dependent protease [Desulfurella acetivorans A63]
MGFRIIEPKEIEFRIDIPNNIDEEKADYFVEQERLNRALKLLVDMQNPYYNLYISGDMGQIKEYIKDKIIELSNNKEFKIYDYAYVNNFKNPKMPKLLVLPKGKANILATRMNEFVEYLVSNIPAIFESKEYENRIQAINLEYNEKQNQIFEELESKASKLDFVIKPTPSGLVVNPVLEGKIITEKEFSMLDVNIKKEIEEKRKQLEVHINEFMFASRELEKERIQKIKKINDEMGLSIISTKLDKIKSEFEGIKCVEDYLNEVEHYTINNIVIFLPSKNEPFPFLSMPSKYIEYKVNVIVDNSNIDIPIYYEQNPTYSNLFGKIEKQAYFGMLVTNFTNIVGGQIVKNNGGFLILDALSALTNPFVWDSLKKTLKSRQLIIEDPFDKYGANVAESLKPEPIDLNIKVILIGDEFLYDLLYEYDGDMKNLFKLKTNFNHMIDAKTSTINQYLANIIKLCKQKNLKIPTKDGLLAVAKYAFRLAESSNKIWSRIDECIDIIEEANTLTTDNIEYKHIQQTIENKIFIKDLYREKIQEMIKEGTILLDLKGEKIGQVNGLSVLQIGDFSFGRPNRIVAKTYVGKGGVINIETESKLSGKIFDKSSFIIGGYIGSKYAYDKPLSLQATISFEQSYSYIEGDSATLAMVIALLSSIAKIPVKNNLAVTGSMSQDGLVQPIGGVNEKIEGFFDVLKISGNLSDAGVVIPYQNKKDLVLRDDVLEAMKQGIFKIYTVETIDDAIEIFMGKPAGKIIKNRYEKGTVHYMVDMAFRKTIKQLKDNNND